MTRASSANARSCDADTVPVDICHLLNAGDDQKWSLGRAFGFPNILAGLQRDCVRRDSDAVGKSFGGDEGPLESNQAGNDRGQRKQIFHGINVQLASPRDAPNRSRLSILFELTQVRTSVLGSRLGM